MRQHPAVVCMIMLGAAASAGDTWTVDSQTPSEKPFGWECSVFGVQCSDAARAVRGCCRGISAGRGPRSAYCWPELDTPVL